VHALGGERDRPALAVHMALYGSQIQPSTIAIDVVWRVLPHREVHVVILMAVCH